MNVTETLKILTGVQDTKDKTIFDESGKLLEVSPVELISGLKVLTTSQRDISLRVNINS